MKNGLSTATDTIRDLKKALDEIFILANNGADMRQIAEKADKASARALFSLDDLRRKFNKDGVPYASGTKV